MLAAKTIVDIANRKPVDLKVKDGPQLSLQVGLPPIIDGIKDTKIKSGCGGAILGIFAPKFKEIADETITADSNIIGLFTEHLTGKILGMKYSGIIPIGKQSTPGNYFVEEQGNGWGGTNASTPQELISKIGPSAWIGMTIFIVETNGARAAILEVQADGTLKELPLSRKAEEVRAEIADLSESANVSAVYVGGIGGSARAGISTAPIEVNRAVRSGLMNITIGGAPTFIFPGGNIIAAVDVENVPQGSFYLTPTPAPIIPVEYTTTFDTYKKIKGHVDNVKDLETIKKERNFRYID